MMNILYITSRAIEINASSSIRNIATIKGLVENGHNVTLCSMRPDNNGKYYDNKIPEVNIKRIYFEPAMKTAIRAANRFNIFHTKLYKMIRGKRIYDNSKQIINHIDEVDVSEYDLVISSSDPKTSHLFAEKLFEKYGKKVAWIQIWGDPFASDMTISGSKNYMKKIEKEEHRLLSKCDSVIYVSSATLDAQKHKYPDASKKMHYLPIPYLKKVISVQKENESANVVKLAYCGDYLSNIRNITPLYDAVSKLQGYSMRICGDSDITLNPVENIHVSGRVPYQEVSKIEDSADILVLICNLFGTQIPGKIYQYSGTDKPVLFILDGNQKVIMQQFEKYRRFDFCSNDSREIRKKLVEITKSKEKRNPVEEFSPQTVAAGIIKTI